MAFKGTLKEFKVPDILQLISLQRKTGILTFTSSEGFITLIFQTGMIVGVDAFPKKLEMRVGSVLVKQDYISEEMLQRALDIQKRTNQKVGEILVGMGLVSQEIIHESLKTQAVEIILSLFNWKRGEYNFKIMEHLDESLVIIEPIHTDNLIMEGVQMLDEWPQIKQLIPEESMVFEPIQTNSQDIEVVSEYEDVPEGDTGAKTYLTETETNLLKHIDGVNTVRDLTEMGVFTEYKVYKGLYSLIRKSIIKAKAKDKAAPHEEEEIKILEEVKIKSARYVSYLFALLITLLTVLLIITFFKPLKPLKSENILLKKAFYENALPTDKKEKRKPIK
jgi:hypothetical protein